MHIQRVPQQISLVQRFTTHDHEDWLKGGEEEYVSGINLEHSLKLQVPVDIQNLRTTQWRLRIVWT